MKTWVVLLRGINVGGKHIVPMKELVKLLEGGGFADVKTYIQSGNVVFKKAAKPKDEIGKLIEKQFGFKPDVFILGETELDKALANNPFKKQEGNRVHFFLCDAKPKTVDFALLESLKTKTETYKLVDNVFYLHAPDGIARSKLVEKLAKAIPKVSMTARNLNTMNKLADMIN